MLHLDALKGIGSASSELNTTAVALKDAVQKMTELLGKIGSVE